MNYQKVFIGGHLTRDCEMKYTTSGTAIGKFGVAVNRRWKDQAGVEKEDVLFIDVDCFGKTAETVAQHFKKGQPIFIEGRLKLNQWEDKQTHQKRSNHTIVLESFAFVGGKADAPKTEPPKPAPKPAPAEPPSEPAADDPADSEIPF